MTEAKCDQRIANLFTKGSHHRNISIVYLTQNVFPQGRACRDIALNTQFIRGIPDYLDNAQFIDPSKRNLIIFDDLMTEAKCDQRIADLFMKGSHHRNIAIVYLTQNVFPQGRACRDIALNTQYLVLFNNPIDRQQVATLARRIYPSTCATFMRKFEDATARPYGYLVLDLKSSTSEQDRLQTNIFVDQQSPDDGDISDDEDTDSVESLDYIRSISPPDKVEMKVINRIYVIGG